MIYMETNLTMPGRTPTLEEYVVNSFLFHEETAQERINEEGLFHSITSISDLILSPENFREAYGMYYRERAIVSETSHEGVFCVTDEKLFQGCVYAILAQQQDYTTQMEVYSGLLEKSLNTRKSILENQHEFRQALGRAMYKKAKARYITELAKNWESLDLAARLRRFTGNQDTELLLRKSIVKDVVGFGEKTASLVMRMAGSEHMVPVDTWMAEMLYLHGYDVDIIRDVVVRENGAHKRRKRAIEGKRYIECEKLALNLAQKYNVPGHILQLAFWTKNSTYRNREFEY